MSTAADNQALIRRYYQAMIDGDLEGIWACFDDAIVYEDAALGHRYEGMQAWKDFYTGYVAALGVKMTLKDVVATGDTYALEYRMDGFHGTDLPGLPATHKPWSVEGASYGKIAGGKIVRNTDYWNLAAMLKQLGLMP